MNIYVFTIRSKADRSLIFAEGANHTHYYSHFELNKKWLTDADLAERNESWYESGDDSYSFDEEIRHLFNYEYDLVSFALEEVEFK